MKSELLFDPQCSTYQVALFSLYYLSMSENPTQTEAQVQQEPLTAEPEMTQAPTQQDMTPSNEFEYSTADSATAEPPQYSDPSLHDMYAQEEVSPQKRRFLPKLWQKIAFVILLLVVLIAAIGGAIGLYTLSIVTQLKAQSNDLQATAKTAYDDFKSQDLAGTQTTMETMPGKLKDMRSTYARLAYLNVIPLAHAYYQDGNHAFNAADAGINAAINTIHLVTPYADVLGLKGKGTFTGGTAEDRLKQILVALQAITPKIDSITGDLQTVHSELAMIDPKRYPENFQGKPLRSYVQQSQDVSNGAVELLTQFRPVLQQLPSIAGSNGRKKYFILFQNNNELRPTGGFLTAYSIITVENGKVAPESSDDIYQLDVKFPKKPPIPPILAKFLTTEKNWNLRDMNIDPDFKNSMQQFMANYALTQGADKSLDGVIAVDTQVLTDLVKILGPVTLDTYGTFSAENSPKCDCPQIIYALSEITDRPTNHIRQDRKGILGPMMRQILTKAYTAPKTLWPQLFETGWADVQARHVQAYFFDAQAQSAAEVLDAAGRMKADPKGGDFQAVVDANLGGAKSNLFVTTSMQKEVSPPANGTLNEKLTLTYNNSRHGDNCNLEAGLLCLNAAMPDWNRIYLPKGSKMVSSQGYIQGTVKQYDEGDFTVIEGQFILEPMSQSKVMVSYTVPYTDGTNYRVNFWKQGGTKDIPIVVSVNGNEDKVTLNKDVTYETKF